VSGNSRAGGMMLANADARAGGRPDACCPSERLETGWVALRARLGEVEGRCRGLGLELVWRGRRQCGELPRLRTHIPTRQSALRVAGRRDRQGARIFGERVRTQQWDDVEFSAPNLVPRAHGKKISPVALCSYQK